MRVHLSTPPRWLRPPLLAALKEVCDLLILPTASSSEFRQALSRLQEVREVLLFSDLPVGVLLAHETAALLECLANGAGRGDDESLYLVLSSLAALKRYLRESPPTRGVAAFLPMLNDLRTLRGGRLFCESYFFTPDLSVVPPASSTLRVERQALTQLHVRRLRSYFQKGFAQWLRQPETGAGLELMEAAATHLQAFCQGHPLASLYWVSAAFLEALREHAVEAGVSARHLLAQVDREIRSLTERGLDACERSAPEGLFKGLLYYLALARDDGEKVVEVRSAFRLSELLAETALPEDAGPSLLALQADADAAARALARARDILESLLTREAGSGDRMADLATILARAADTLALLGQEDVRGSLSQRLLVLEERIAGNDKPTETELAALAGSLVDADRALQGIAETRLNEAIQRPERAERAPDGLADFLSLAKDKVAEIRAAVGPLFERTGRVRNPGHVMNQLQEVGDGLGKWGLDSAAVVVSDCAAYLESLLRSGEPPVTDEQTDAVAEALVGLGYYLDSRLDSDAPAEGLLEEIRGRLAILDMPPPGDESAQLAVKEVQPSEEIALARRPGESEIPDELAGEVVTGEDAEEITLQAAPVPAATARARQLPPRLVASILHAQELFQNIEGSSASRVGERVEPAALPLTRGAPYADSEFIDVFVEEAATVAATLDEQLARWRKCPDDAKAAERLRQAFHTLKDSACLVGAWGIGELASGLERMMTNVVAAGPVPPVVELLEDVRQTLIQAIRSLGQDQVPMLDVEGLVTRVGLLGQTLVAASRGSVESGSARPASASPVLGPETMAGEPESLDRVPVRARSLDELTHFATEIGMSRDRMEQQVGAVRGGLEEMERALEHLREQLVELESRKESEGPEGGGTPAGDSQSDPAQAVPAEKRLRTTPGVAGSLSQLEKLHENLHGLIHDSQRTLRRQARVSENLQRGLVSTRLVPVARYVPWLHRMVSQTAQRLGKSVELGVDGPDVMVDGYLLSRLVAPLEQVLRDIVDHGLEVSEERERTGKSVPARVSLSVSLSGPEMIVRISDDGRGLDLNTVRKEANERGLLAAQGEMSDQELIQFVLGQAAGTEPELIQALGGGTGLETLGRTVRQLGGAVTLETQAGRGTAIIIHLPAVAGTSQLLMVEAVHGRYAVPLASVEGVLRISAVELETARARQPPAVEHRRHAYPLAHLDRLLEEGGQAIPPATGSHAVLLVRAGDRRLALLLNRVAERFDMVVEPVGPPASLVGWIAGAAVMAEGKVVPVLDVTDLIRRASDRPHSLSNQTETEAASSELC